MATISLSLSLLLLPGLRGELSPPGSISLSLSLSPSLSLIAESIEAALCASRASAPGQLSRCQSPYPYRHLSHTTRPSSAEQAKPFPVAETMAGNHDSISRFDNLIDVVDAFLVLDLPERSHTGQIVSRHDAKLRVAL